MSETSTLEPDTIQTTDIDEAFKSILENEEMVDHSDDDEGNHDRMSHYVDKDQIAKSSMTGKPVRALCGKKWTPNKNPENYPVCETCKGIYEKMKK